MFRSSYVFLLISFSLSISSAPIQVNTEEWMSHNDQISKQQDRTRMAAGPQIHMAKEVGTSSPIQKTTSLRQTEPLVHSITHEVEAGLQTPGETELADIGHKIPPIVAAAASSPQIKKTKIDNAGNQVQTETEEGDTRRGILNMAETVDTGLELPTTAKAVDEEAVLETRCFGGSGDGSRRQRRRRRGQSPPSSRRRSRSPTRGSDAEAVMGVPTLPPGMTVTGYHPDHVVTGWRAPDRT